MSRRERAAVRVSLTERVRIEAGGAVVEEAHLPGRQGRLVFAYLVAAQGRPVPRDELAEALWGDVPPATWEKALSLLISKLRGLLGRARAGRVRASDERFRLLPAHPAGRHLGRRSRCRRGSDRGRARARGGRPRRGPRRGVDGRDDRSAHLPAGRGRALGRGGARRAPGNARGRALELPGGGEPAVGRCSRGGEVRAERADCRSSRSARLDTGA